MARWCKLIVVWMVVLALPGAAWAAAAAPCALMMSAGAAAGAAMSPMIARADIGAAERLPCHDLPAAEAPAVTDAGAASPAHDAAASGTHACAACAHCLMGHAVALLPAALCAPGLHALPAEPTAGPLSPWASVLLAGPERPPRSGR